LIVAESRAVLSWRIAASRDNSSRFKVDLPATGAQSERVAASLADHERHHRIVAWHVVIIQVRATQHEESVVQVCLGLHP